MVTDSTTGSSSGSQKDFKCRDRASVVDSGAWYVSVEFRVLGGDIQPGSENTH